jgi:rod shape-determining protein MreD
VSSLYSQRPPLLKALPIYLVNLILLILSTQTVDFLAVDNVHVVVFLTAIFYWVVHMPAVLPLWFIFIAGLAIDFSLDSLLGLHAFAFVLYTLILYKTRRIILSQPYVYHLIIFVVSVAFFELLRWGVISLLSMQILSIFPSLLAVVVNIVAFIPLTLVLRHLHRVISGYGRSSL